jgi:hypothetical protein
MKVLMVTLFVGGWLIYLNLFSLFLDFKGLR